MRRAVSGMMVAALKQVFLCFVTRSPTALYVIIKETCSLPKTSKETKCMFCFKPSPSYILKAVGVKVGYGEPLYEGEYRGTFGTVSDKEHAEMIRLYIEERLSLEKIAVSKPFKPHSTIARSEA